MDVTTLAAIIAAVSAVSAPTITAHINNRHQEKMKRLELFESAKREAYSEFAKAFKAEYNISTITQNDAVRSILSATYDAMTYCPKSTKYRFKDFAELVQKGALFKSDKTEIQNAFFSCLDAIQDDVQAIVR